MPSVSFFSSVAPTSLAAIFSAASSPPLSVASFMAINLFIISVMSTLSSMPSSILLTIFSRVSRHPNNTVTTFCVTFNFPSLNSDNTSSILWVNSAISENPIVAAIPFIVWATLNISFSLSISSGFCSSSNNDSFNVWRLSIDSPRNISKYCDVSMYKFPLYTFW